MNFRVFFSAANHPQRSAKRLAPTNKSNSPSTKHQIAQQHPRNLIRSFLLLISFMLAGCAGGVSADDVQRIAITHINLVPMTAEIILADQTVLINGDRITAIGPADDLKVPSGATVFDGTGADLILIGGNPFEDITNIDEILGVLAAGRWYSQEVLDEMIRLEP